MLILLVEAAELEVEYGIVFVIRLKELELFDLLDSSGFLVCAALLIEDVSVACFGLAAETEQGEGE